MYLKCLYFDWYCQFPVWSLMVLIPWHREVTKHALVAFHLQIYYKNIDNSNKTVVFFYDKTHFLTRLVSLQPLKGLFNIPKPIFTTRLLWPTFRNREGRRLLHLEGRCHRRHSHGVSMSSSPPSNPLESRRFSLPSGEGAIYLPPPAKKKSPYKYIKEVTIYK